MLMHNVALELRRSDDSAVSEFKVLDEQTRPVEGLMAADALELLVHFVVLRLVSVPDTML
jgi:hypothetical protein